MIYESGSDAIYILNELGREVWLRIGAVSSLKELAGSIALDYEVNPEVAEVDITSFVQAHPRIFILEGEESLS
ncbi:PqqD family protein [Azotobacter sp. CWF10]